MKKTSNNKSTWLIPLLVVGLPVLASYFFFLFTGKIYLQRKMEQFLDEEITADSDTEEEKYIEDSGFTTQEQTFTEDSFRWEYKGEKTGIVIRLEDCDCLYESDNFRIYSVYLDDVLPENSSYRYSGELLYLQTPQKSLQLYPDEYVIDDESGTIYILYHENDFFASIYSYCAATDATGEIWGAAFLKPTLLEEWIPEAHGLPVYSSDRPWARCSNLRVHMKGLSREQGEAVLLGEASGIYEGTGETYCIEWESDVNGSKEKLTPATPKIYDEEKDKAVFEACTAAFDRMEQGDWSVVAGREDKTNRDDWQWRRMDVNGDGLPELILEEDANGLGISPILGIYAYVDGAEQPVKEVFSDFNDFTEYHFVGADGKLIYDYSNHGVVAFGGYSEYRFDEQWNHKLVDKIEIYYFYDHYKEYEDEHELVSEDYPETYGARGSGYYYFRSRRRTMEELEEIDAYQEEDMYWVREEVSREEFVRVYKEMTGLDFFRVNTGFPSE